MENYQKLEKLGEGSYGKVYRAIETATGKIVALKKSRLDMSQEGIPPSALREISLLHRLSRSIYVVQLLGVEYVETKSQPPKTNLYLIFEYLDTDLSSFIYSHQQPLEPFLIQKLMFQLCKGVAHCHSHGVLHRDLKPANLLMVKDTQLLKIADLGLGRGFNVPLKAYSPKVATLWYKAPELLLGFTQYTTTFDMWSVGCIFAEMARRQPLFPGNSEISQMELIFSLLGKPTEQQWPGVSTRPVWNAFEEWTPQDLTTAFPFLSPQGVDLLSKMLTCNPAERIEAKTALDHPYFDSLDKSQF